MSSPREFLETSRSEESKRRVKRWIGVSAGALILLIAGVLLWLFFLSTTFSAKEVVVQGVKLLDVQAVRQSASVRSDVPLARLDTNAIRERVEKLPEVRKAEVSVDYPSTVRIQVTERVALYQLAKQNAFSWVDAEGVEFRTGQGRSKTLPEAKLRRDDERIRRDVATVATHVPQAAKGKVTQISARSVDRIELSLADKRTIIWGSADESELKSEVLQTLLSVDAKVYDVSAPQHPTTK
ncbi:MAG: FtsQ-type POTRA domain-containing protein [Propionibacteriaceae bacterium]|nr:FtsQ-type POTRA domain-containing protein [Propionibacteriaceae bacterium]